MPISTLQKQALLSANDFMAQVYDIVTTEALYKFDTIDNLDPGSIQTISRVINNPSQFGFPQTIIADSGWTLTYDPWAANPPDADGAIRSGVNKYFSLLTGFNPAAPVTPQP
jgi:hypothetical protein